MRNALAAWLFGAVLLAGCERHPQADGDQTVDANNPLEMAARERGIVRPDTASPTGVFERSHELGRDAMCVMPDGAGQWRFALSASFGPGLRCAARGTIVREGQGWRMLFADAEGCEALVHEEEDELRLPGDLSAQCQTICSARASLSGLRLPRASWSEEDAKRLQIADAQGNMTRPCGS